MNHVVHIPNWRPHTVNELLGAHWRQAGRWKGADAQMIGAYCYKQQIPKAKGKRRVEIIMTCAQGRSLDQDSIQKSLLDALVISGYLKDDSPTWLDFGGVTIQRGKQRATTIIIGDV